MQTKYIELHNFGNWGKFMIMGYSDDDWAAKSQVDFRPILSGRGQRREALWVMDLQTGEGAIFYTHGYYGADLRSHKIWVCPLFEKFLKWLYDNKVNGLSDFDQLPSVIELPKDYPVQCGYRRPGPPPKFKARSRSKSGGRKKPTRVWWGKQAT